MRIEAPKKPVKWLIDNIEKLNIADQFDESLLNQIGGDILSNALIDEQSRQEWKDQAEYGLKVAKQVIEPKSHPWENAANTKDPLIAIACSQFAARSGAEVIRGRDVVKTQITGEDPEGIKEKRGKRIGQYMSYQCLDLMTEWESDTDQLLTSVAGFGMYYKKTYWDELLGRPVSCSISPLKLIVNQNVKSLETAERISEKMLFNRNETIERIRAGLWLDITDSLDQDPSTFDNMIECHCWYDLDGDGYKEPYVITVNEESQKVVRVAPRYEASGVQLNDKKEIKRIVAIQYYTEFCFLPSPDGTFHKMGFFQLLGALNDEINSIQNQLIDAGTLANLQGGFVGKNARFPAGGMRLKPGEWRPIEVTGQNLKDAIFPLPVKEPSGVLFNLLARLDDKGMKLASVSETMMGEQPGQNSPATTTLAVLDQGLKVFSSILKRLFRAFKSEYAKLYKLNFLHLTDKEYLNVLDLSQDEIKQLVQLVGKPVDGNSRILVEMDFNQSNCDIQPIIDPTASSEALRLARANALMQSDPSNPEIRRDYYQMLGVPESRINAYVPKPDPNAPPPPDIIKLQAEIAEKKQKGENEHQKLINEAIKMEQEEVLLPFKAKVLAAQALSMESQAEKTKAEAALIPVNAQLTILEQHFNETKQRFEAELEILKHQFERETAQNEQSGVSDKGAEQTNSGDVVETAGNASDNGAPEAGETGNTGNTSGGNWELNTGDGGEGMVESIGGDSGAKPYTDAKELAAAESRPGSMM